MRTRMFLFEDKYMKRKCLYESCNRSYLYTSYDSFDMTHILLLRTFCIKFLARSLLILLLEFLLRLPQLFFLHKKCVLIPFHTLLPLRIFLPLFLSLWLLLLLHLALNLTLIGRLLFLLHYQNLHFLLLS